MIGSQRGFSFWLASFPLLAVSLDGGMGWGERENMNGNAS